MNLLMMWFQYSEKNAHKEFCEKKTDWPILWHQFNMNISNFNIMLTLNENVYVRVFVSAIFISFKMCTVYCVALQSAYQNFLTKKPEDLLGNRVKCYKFNVRLFQMSQQIRSTINDNKLATMVNVKSNKIHEWPTIKMQVKYHQCLLLSNYDYIYHDQVKHLYMCAHKFTLYICYHQLPLNKNHSFQFKLKFSLVCHYLIAVSCLIL